MSRREPGVRIHSVPTGHSFQQSGEPRVGRRALAFSGPEGAEQGPLRTCPVEEWGLVHQLGEVWSWVGQAWSWSGREKGEGMPCVDVYPNGRGGPRRNWERRRRQKRKGGKEGRGLWVKGGVRNEEKKGEEKQEEKERKEERGGGRGELKRRGQGTEENQRRASDLGSQSSRSTWASITHVGQAKKNTNPQEGHDPQICF